MKLLKVETLPTCEFGCPHPARFRWSMRAEGPFAYGCRFHRRQWGPSLRNRFLYLLERFDEHDDWS